MKVEKTKTEYEFNSKSEINLNQTEVEKKLLKRFSNLEKEENLHELFSSYDFRLQEKSMVETWEQILHYLITDIFSSFGASMSDLKNYTIIKNTIPIGLNNIIHQLRIEQKYITEEDLKSDIFYQINYPDLYPQSKGYISSFLSGLQSVLNVAGGKIGCKEEEKDKSGQEMPIRTDISEDDKYKIIPENTIIFNFEAFRNHSNKILSALMEILQEKDEVVITVDKFKKEIIENYTDKEGQVGGLISLKYGIQFIDYVLFFLMKIKKIALFEIDFNTRKIKYIKLLNGIEDTITEKDKAISKLLVHLESLDKKINEYQKKIDVQLNEAKIQVKNGNKKAAKSLIVKKKNYEKFLENIQNTQNVLEQQIFALKTAESNASVTDVLKNCLEAEKKIGMNPDDFADVANDLKDVKESMEEINAGMKEFVDEKEEDELNKELEKLEIENKKETNLEFPNPNKEKIEDDELFDDLVK